MNKLRVDVDRGRLKDSAYMKEVCDRFSGLKIIRAKMGVTVFEAIMLMQYNFEIDGPITAERGLYNKPTYFFYGAELKEIVPKKISPFAYGDDNSFFIEATHE